MKHYLYIVASCVVWMACTKSSNWRQTPVSFTGKWYYTEAYSSNGSAGQWSPAEKNNQWIALNTDGSFSSNFSPFDKATDYQITDSSHIKFSSPLRSDSLYYFFRLDTIHNTLTLSPAIYICIEGCAQKFSKAPKLF